MWCSIAQDFISFTSCAFHCNTLNWFLSWFWNVWNIWLGITIYFRYVFRHYATNMYDASIGGAWEALKAAVSTWMQHFKGTDDSERKRGRMWPERRRQTPYKETLHSRFLLSSCWSCQGSTATSSSSASMSFSFCQKVGYIS